MSGDRQQLTKPQRWALDNFPRLPSDAGLDAVTVAALMTTTAATVYRRSAEGKLPAPVRRAGLTRWKVGDIRKVLSGEWTPGQQDNGKTDEVV